jgi:hypothetical protein
MTLGLPVGAVMNCADNTGAKNLYVISVKRACPAQQKTSVTSSCEPRRRWPLHPHSDGWSRVSGTGVPFSLTGAAAGL